MRFLEHLVFAGTALAACNGHDELCSRKYSDVVFMGAHDSAFVGDSPVHDQYVSVTQQLDLGVRFLEAQTHNKDGSIEMCHTYCWELDEGSLSQYLKEIADWMSAHPDEVVTVLLTNGDAIAIESFDAAFESSGLKQYVFRPDHLLTKDQWPTLQQMLDSKTRLVALMDYNSDQSKVDYILPEFDYFWETPYGVTDNKFPTCDVDRPSGGNPSDLMGIMNHMLNYKIGDIVFPDQIDAGNTNSQSSIQAQVDLCVSKWSLKPNVVLLDWVNIGEAAQAGLALNGLS